MVIQRCRQVRLGFDVKDHHGSRSAGTRIVMVSPSGTADEPDFVDRVGFHGKTRIAHGLVSCQQLELAVPRGHVG